MSLTARQAQLLKFIRERIETDNIAPSFDEMMVHMGLKSKSGVSRMIYGLIDRGEIYMPPKGRRRITLTNAGSLANFTADQLLAELRDRGFALNGARQ